MFGGRNHLHGHFNYDQEESDNEIVIISQEKTT